MLEDVGMSGMTERIVVVVLVGLVIGEFIWFRNNQPPPFGPCVQLAGTNNEIPVYYRQGDPSFTTHSSAERSSESRITV
jgi:hypothetical protein